MLKPVLVECADRGEDAEASPAGLETKHNGDTPRSSFAKSWLTEEGGEIPREHRMMSVDFRDISDALDFVSFGSLYEHQAFLDRKTGKIYYHSEFGDSFDELPEDIDSDRYIGIPHKNELDLGKNLVLDFAYRYLPEAVEEVLDMFRRKGAYSNFKSLLDEQGMLEQWYEFEASAQEKALRGWCESRSIQVNG